MAQKIYRADATEGVTLLRRVPRMVTKLAREMKISRTAIYGWKVVPAERIIEVERHSGIPRELLRPDLYERAEA